MMTFDEWLKFGYQQGFCSPPVCWFHDGLPTSVFEDDEVDAEGETCLHIIRLYEDQEMKRAVEANHAAAVWRAKNLGW
jgi:hypothetical protein